MKSEFCQWCTDLQKIANKDSVIVEAQHFDILEYLFRTGHTPEDAYPNYIEVKKRLEAIELVEE